MQFKLTESLEDGILFAMENQNSEFTVNSASGELVDIRDSASEADDAECFPIPVWTSDDGYALMQSFTENLHSPQAKEELRRAVTGGRGVFRNFKNVLRQYPEVEKLWFAYKNKVMRSRISEWYNELCESWGLEKIEETEFSADETDDLVKSDFQFAEFDSLRDREDIRLEKLNLAEEYKELYADEFGRALSSLYFDGKDTFEGKKGIVCRSQSDEFLGCLLYSECTFPAEKTVTVTDFFVSRNYRGLGIGREMLERLMSLSEKCGDRLILFTNIFVSEAMESLLEQFSFERHGSVFAGTTGEKHGL